MNFADRIAYLNHDIDDAVRAGILTEDQLPPFAMDVLGRGHSERIDTMIRDIVRQSEGQPFVRQSPEVAAATNELRAYMFSEVYLGGKAKEEEKKVQDVIFLLMAHYLAHPEELPETERKNLLRDGDLVCTADYVSGHDGQICRHEVSGIVCAPGVGIAIGEEIGEI